MTKELLRHECSRLFICEKISDSDDMLDIYAEFFFNTIKNHHDEPVFSQADADAKMIIQMMLTKVLHLKSVISGISYKSRDGSILNKIVDPTIVASLIRNIYETTAMFNLIYRYTKSVEEKEILYLLWVHAGLKFRQRFENVILTEENRTKHKAEKAELETIVSIIEANTLFLKLDEKNRGKIRTKLNERDFLVKFEGTDVVYLHWHQLTTTMGIKELLLGDIYTFFSLYSHPSNVAVFQFSEMFKKGEESFAQMTNFNLKIAFFMFSIFIADYIQLFPSVLKTFETMEIRDQIVINFHNTTTRNEQYSINDAFNSLE
jgi:hypothetical protein